MPNAMPFYDGIYDAAIATESAIFVMAELLPEQMHTKLDGYVGEHFGDSSPVDLICNFVESVYANRPLLVPGSPVTTGLMLVAAGVASIVSNYGFWSNLNGRCPAIIQALRRDGGETAEVGFPWPDPADDPAAAAGYGPSGA